LGLAGDINRAGLVARHRPAGLRAGHSSRHHFPDALRQGCQHPRRIERRGFRRTVPGDDGVDGDSDPRRMAAKTRLGGHCLDLRGRLHRQWRAATPVAPKNETTKAEPGRSSAGARPMTDAPPTGGYEPPKVWTWKENGGRFAAINRPIAGPT